jgi:hypothetical protein
MFLQVASYEERLKILHLEPFDELEEWHLEGCHFALMVASKGSLAGWFVKFADISRNVMISCVRKPRVQWELVQPGSEPAMCRFAQKTVKVREKDGFDILVVGGFGPSTESLHGRRHEVLNICSRYTSSLTVVYLIFIGGIGNRLGARVHYLSGTKRFFFYGRHLDWLWGPCDLVGIRGCFTRGEVVGY